MPFNFAMTGVGGYVARRHLQAIRATGNTLVAALDPHDSVGILDEYYPEAAFFTEFERFDRHLEKLRRQGEEQRVHYLSICSPNYLHDAHVRLALRIGAHAICEKPLVLNPWNVDLLSELEKESGRRVFTILQLRLHPVLVALKKRLECEDQSYMHDVDLTYITPRGKWYCVSWKGQLDKSGGVTTNIGIHFFDALLWLFGGVRNNEVHFLQPTRAAGHLELQRARVRWFLSLEGNDLAKIPGAQGNKPYRSIKLDGEEMEYSNGFNELHCRSYEQILQGHGFGLDDVRPSVELVYRIRNAAN